MKIAIIGAMDEEIALLKEQMIIKNTLNKASFTIYLGELHGHDIALVKSGIGKVAAAVGTTLLLTLFNADLVINTGSAGALSPSLNIGDVVVSSTACYHDVDVTAFGYAPGQMAGFPLHFSSKQTFNELAINCANALQLSAVSGLICSGDAFINGKTVLTQIKTQFPTALAVEMESTAIAQTCALLDVNFLIIRAISDTADQSSHVNFEDFLPLAAARSSELVQNVIKLL